MVGDGLSGVESAQIIQGIMIYDRDLGQGNLSTLSPVGQWFSTLASF